MFLLQVLYEMHIRKFRPKMNITLRAITPVLNGLVSTFLLMQHIFYFL